MEVAPKSYIRWLDDHVHSYFAVGLRSPSTPLRVLQVNLSRRTP